MTRRSIEAVVLQFEGLEDDDRYALLSEMFAEDAVSKSELDYRARLCTALEAAGVYPQRGPYDEVV